MSETIPTVAGDGSIVADGPARALLADRGLMERHGLRVPLSLQARR